MSTATPNHNAKPHPVQTEDMCVSRSLARACTPLPTHTPRPREVAARTPTPRARAPRRAFRLPLAIPGSLNLGPPLDTEPPPSPGLCGHRPLSECDYSPNDSESASGAEEPNVGSPGRTPPIVGTKRSGKFTPARRVSQRTGDDCASGAPSPCHDGSSTSGAHHLALSPDSERKIWMRACNMCGHELHVRRTKCTSCGSLQMSKRTMLSANEEKERQERAARDQATMAAEAALAASSLKLIATQPSLAVDSAPATADAYALLAVNGTASDFEAVSSAAIVDEPAAAPAEPTAAAVAPPSRARAQCRRIRLAIARLSPAGLLKLRRLHKLRVLLTKVPAEAQGVLRAPPAPPSTRSAQGKAADADAIAMLASVACM